MNHDEQIKQWIKEAGTDRPGTDFADLVMAKIEKAPSTALEYKPGHIPNRYKNNYWWHCASLFGRDLDHLRAGCNEYSELADFI